MSVRFPIHERIESRRKGYDKAPRRVLLRQSYSLPVAIEPSSDQVSTFRQIAGKLSPQWNASCSVPRGELVRRFAHDSPFFSSFDGGRPLRNSLQFEIERLAKWRRVRLALLIPAIISPILLAFYCWKFLLRGQLPEAYQDSPLVGFLWYWSPTPAISSAPLPPERIYSFALLAVIVCFAWASRHIRKKKAWLDSLRRQVREERLRNHIRQSE
jgi:hypothetical protein